MPYYTPGKKVFLLYTPRALLQANTVVHVVRLRAIIVCITSVLYMFQSSDNVHTGTKKAEWNSGVRLKTPTIRYLFFSLYLTPIPQWLAQRESDMRGSAVQHIYNNT